jgi:hypothetical protein
MARTQYRLPISTEALLATRDIYRYVFSLPDQFDLAMQHSQLQAPMHRQALAVMRVLEEVVEVVGRLQAGDPDLLAVAELEKSQARLEPEAQVPVALLGRSIFMVDRV